MQGFLIFFFVFILEIPLLAFAERDFSFRSNTPPESSRIAEFSQSQVWLRFGEWSNGHTSPLSEAFFLSSSGSTDPQSELLDSIQYFLNFTKIKMPEDQSRSELAICRFQARWYLIKKANLLSPDQIALVDNSYQQNCQHRIQWKKDLDAQSLVLVFASADVRTASSSFGHSFLRIKTKRPRPELLQYSINYAAITDNSNPALYALKGLFGFYPGNYSILPYHQKIQEYNSLEARDLWEYDLKVSADETDFVIDYLLERTGSWKPYFFLSDNCASEIIKILNIARQNQSISLSTPWVIPIESVKAIAKAGLLEDPKYRPSLQKEVEKKFRLLNNSEQQRFLSLQIQRLQTEKWETLLTEEEKQSPFFIEALLAKENLDLFTQQKGSKERFYNLALIRAKITTDLKTFTPSEDPASIQDPVLGRNLQSILLQSSSAGELLVSYIPASHDSLDQDSFHLPWTQLQTMKPQIFIKDNRPRYLNFDLIDILSTDDFFSLYGKSSWKMQIGLKDQNAMIDLGYGVAKDFPEIESRILFLSQLRTPTAFYQNSSLSVRQPLIKENPLSPGLGIFIFKRWSPVLVSKATWQEVYLANHWLNALEIETSLKLNHDLQLRLNLNQTAEDNGLSLNAKISF